MKLVEPLIILISRLIVITGRAGQIDFSFAQILADANDYKGLSIFFMSGSFLCMKGLNLMADGGLTV